jgi:hypothetical protein
MSTAFSFFLRLFLCFVGAKFLLQAIDVEGRGYLVGLTSLFLVNVYWFSYLVFRDRTASPADAGNAQAQSATIDPAPIQAEPQENQDPPQA